MSARRSILRDVARARGLPLWPLWFIGARPGRLRRKIWKRYTSCNGYPTDYDEVLDIAKVL